MISDRSRVERIEAAVVGLAEACAGCGWPRLQAPEYVALETGQALDRCPECGLYVTPGGLPMGRRVHKLQVWTPDMK